MLDPAGGSLIGLDVLARPFEEGDAERIVRMFGRLSPQTVARRFFTASPSVSEQFLKALTSVDHDLHEALVIEVGGEIVALASYHRNATDRAVADVAVLVEDGWQHHGLGGRLMKELAELAATRGISRLRADVLFDNRPAVAMIRRARNGTRTGWDGHVLSYDLPLEAA